MSIVIVVPAVSDPEYSEVAVNVDIFGLIVYVPPLGAGIFTCDFGVIRILYWTDDVVAVNAFVDSVIDGVLVAGFDTEP